MKLADVLTGPEVWTKGAVGRDAEGHYCEPEDPRAVKFCIRGAAFKAAGIPVKYDSVGRQIDEALAQAVLAVYPRLPECEGYRSSYPHTLLNNDEACTFEDLKPVIAEYDRIREAELVRS